jgi:LmbE family N-acetylglucosaminyl deacetylase
VAAPALQPLEVALLGRVYDGLHARLTFPPRAQRVLWVGAHPDDEAFYAAPVLGHLCRDLGGTCTLLVATDGATGGCQVPAGCPPDLGTFRRAEMVRAAALYGATLRQLAWPPGPFPSETAADLARWSASQGGAAALVVTLRTVIDETDPEVLITFDPRHGSSCHAEHRVVSGLALEALRQSGKQPLVLLSEGLNPPPRFSDQRLLQFDASIASRTTGSDAWAFVAANLALHPSQITPADVLPYANLPGPLRRLYFLSEPQPPPDSRYQFCPNP